MSQDIEEMRQESIEQGKKELLAALVADGDLTTAQAAQWMGIDEATYLACAQALEAGK